MIKPAKRAKAGSLLRHIKIDSGRSSPNTTYIIAPLAKPSDSTSIISLIPPSAKPSRAPNTVGKPLNAVRSAALGFFIPPAIRGTETAIPSGTLCSPITIAIINPLPVKMFAARSSESAYDAPITIPSGRL